MPMIRIVFIIPYCEFEEVVEQVFSERHDKSKISHKIIVVKPRDVGLFDHDGDVVISRGYTAAALKEISLPNVELTTTGYDVMAAVNECVRKFGSKKIGIFGTLNMIYGSESAKDMYHNISISSFIANKESELKPAVEKAVSEGIDAVVGGLSVYNIAQDMGINTVMIKAGKESVCKAIDDAIRIVELTRREKEKRDRIKAIMNYSFEGIISTDKDGMITLINKYATSFFNIEMEKAIGVHISEYLPMLNIESVIKDNKKVLGEIQKLEKMMISVNCAAIKGKQENTGSVITFQNVTKIQELEGKIRKELHVKGFVAKYSFNDILHSNKSSMNEVIRIAKRFSESDSNVLIFGETGTGKELFAQSLHNASERCKGPFVAINCAALPEQLLESELFGYVEGAFTGAVKGGKTGLFEIAHNGTIFLDEIGDISAKLQARLLRVIQEREIIRLGHDRVIPINVRIISASNKDLHEEVDKGNFRQDLLYRLDVLKLEIPPLREREDDIMLLINHFMDKECEKSNCNYKRFSRDAQSLVLEHAWPGNVRELRNFCERICVLCESEMVSSEDIYRALEKNKRKDKDKQIIDTCSPFNFTASIGEAEKEAIVTALKRSSYSRKDAAYLLGIDKSTLWRKMKRYNISSQK
ncbi:MAG: proprionate catabolism activator, Fis family [Clostridiales bacterium]|nr:proprionate catabolism activator, Fis family [Clostridiales bacterium]